MSIRKIVLGKPLDWDTWISFVKSRADNNDIWELVNPELTEKPETLKKPQKPNYDLPEDDAQFDQKKFEAYKARMQLYKADLAEYEKQKKAFGDLISFIQETITTSTAIFIQKEDTHPWNLLRALKRRLAPSDDARSLEIEQKYIKLRKGPANQDLDKWLDEWCTTYTEVKTYQVAEVSGTRPIRDFLLAIHSKAPTFADTHLMSYKIKTEADLLDMIEQFRQYMRLHQSQTDSQAGGHSAFATSQTQQNQSRNSTNKSSRPNVNSCASFRGKQVATPGTCVCGQTHWYSDCLYLNLGIRPANWKPDPIIQAKVDECMREERTRDKVNRSLDKNRMILEKQKNKNSIKMSANATDTSNAATEASIPQSTNTGAYACVRTVFSTEFYTLNSTWILDGGSNCHVCNSTMLSRFTRQRQAQHGEFLIAGNTYLPIEYYGTITITIETPSGSGIITLLNVAYVADFMTNIVSQDILRSKGLYFDNWKMHLHREGVSIGFVKPYNGHYIMEDNINKAPHKESTAFSAVKVATTNQWHQMLAHASNDAIERLETSAEGVKISDKDTATVPQTNKCEPCALSKAHRIVSRSPDKAETSEKPFHRVTYDLMQLTVAMNKDQWVSHFACSKYDFNLVFTHAHKSDATSIIRQAIHTIETRYNGKAVFFRSDGERSFGKSFQDFITEKGITYESSAPDTPEQNGHSERKGGVLATKARAMRIQAGVPLYLGHEIIRTAGYIANRTPMRKHNWKTPYEMVTGNPPNLSHLHTFGCKAYTLDKHIPRMKKLQERAHIGYLVGYDSSNIFRIWIPSRHKVIRTRDVVFDDDSFYNAHDLDVLQIATKPMLDVTFDTLKLNSTIQLTEVESDEDDVELTAITPSTETKEVKMTEKVNTTTQEDNLGNNSYLPTPDSSEREGTQESRTASSEASSLDNENSPEHSLDSQDTSIDEDTIILAPRNTSSTAQEARGVSETQSQNRNQLLNMVSRANEISSSFDATTSCLRG